MRGKGGIAVMAVDRDVCTIADTGDGETPGTCMNEVESVCRGVEAKCMRI